MQGMWADQNREASCEGQGDVSAGFTITDVGFEVPRLPEARDRIVELWRSGFGEGSRTDSTTPDGLLIDIASLLLTLVWQGQGASTANAYLRTSYGAFVDQILDLFARRRIQAAASTASLVFYGTDATALASGVQARTEEGGIFATDADATIGDGDLVAVFTIDTIAAVQLYRATVDAVDYDYTSDGDPTRDEIVTGLLAELNDVTTGVDGVAYDGGDDADGIPRIVVEIEAAGTFVGSAEVTAYPAVRVAATCTDTGPTQGTATLIAIVNTPQAGLVGVTNTGDATVGRDLETDSAFKIRHWANLSANGARSPDAIAARLMDEDGPAGIEVARVFENESPLEVDGRPPHSFETYVLGGDDQEIADLIWQQKPAGIRAFGTTEVSVEGADGRQHVVGFTRPTSLYLHLRITVVGGEGYPSTGTPLTTIRNAVAAWIGDGGEGELELGQDFYRFSLGQPIAAAVPGIVSIAVETDTTAAPDDVPSFSSADVTVADNEILRSDASRITVV